jgi:hypothetical protein
MLWKNGPVSSMPPLLALYVCDAPFGLGKNTPFGMNEKIPVNGLCCSAPAPARAARIAPVNNAEITIRRLNARVELAMRWQAK